MKHFFQMNRYLVIIIAVVFGINSNASAQRTIAVPQIINYSNEVYKGGLQNWSVAQDAQGIMYFGNNEGLMTFDGYNWSVFHLPNQTIVRSVAVDTNGRVYVGGQDELGYFEADNSGSMQYHSLVPLIAEGEREFADVWRISIVPEGVFFMTNNRIFRFQADHISVDKNAGMWQFMGEVGGRLFAQSQGQGMLWFDEGFWKPLTEYPDLEITPVTQILPYARDTLLISTLKDRKSVV